MNKSERTRRLRAWLSARESDLVEFTRRLVQTPSVNPPGDERAVAELCCAVAADLGLPAPRQIAREPHRPNLIFRVAGDRPGPTLAFNAHLDTKPPGELARWQVDPFAAAIVDGYLYGLGCGDMKATVAAMLFAAAALRDLGDLAGTLLVVLSADEENGALYGARYLVEARAFEADALLIGEPSGIVEEWEALHLVSRGVSTFRVRVHGTQQHSSISDRLPNVNASVKMARLLATMKESLRLRYPPHPLIPRGPTINPGVIVSGGVWYGVNPGLAEFGTDIRVIPGMDFETLREDLERWLAEARAADPELQAEIVFEAAPGSWVPPTEIPADHPLVLATLQAAEAVLGRRPPLAGYPAGTDASWYQGLGGILTIPSFGPGMLPLAHSPNERLRVGAILEAAQIYALTAATYLRG